MILGRQNILENNLMPLVWLGVLSSKVDRFFSLKLNITPRHIKKTNAFYFVYFIFIFHTILIEDSKCQRMKLTFFYIQRYNLSE